MNNRFFISLAAVAVSLVSLPSCQKDQDSVFKESLTERQAQYLDGFRSLIKGSENGWAMYYFSGGAYATSRVFTVSFTDNEVTASSEDAPSVTAKSFYKVAVTSAPSLIFDTYNSVLHTYAAPSHSYYQGRGGDFEFTIENYSEEKITLVGRRAYEQQILIPLKESPASYLNKVKSFGQSFNLTQVAGKVGNGDVVIYFDLRNRFLYIGRLGAEDTELEEIPYIYTENSLLLQHPFWYNGTTFSEFSYNAEEHSITSEGITFKQF